MQPEYAGVDEPGLAILKRHNDDWSALTVGRITTATPSRRFKASMAIEGSMIPSSTLSPCILAHWALSSSTSAE